MVGLGPTWCTSFVSKAAHVAEQEVGTRCYRGAASTFEMRLRITIVVVRFSFSCFRRRRVLLVGIVYAVVSLGEACRYQRYRIYEQRIDSSRI
jgi:hypothetical protein